MKLALVTDSVVARSHGTGNLLIRLLEGGPVSVSAFHPGPATSPPDFPSFAVTGRKTAAGVRDALRRRLPGFIRGAVPSPGSIRRWRYSPDAKAARHLNDADIVLVVVHTADGLRFAHDLVASLSAPKPVVLWFMDLVVAREDIGDPRRSLPLFEQARIWAFNSRIRCGLAELFPERRQEIEQHRFLGVRLPKPGPKLVRPLAADTRCVMIGNIWDASVLPLLDAVWQRACALHGTQLILRWFAPPEAFERLAGAALGRGLRYEGHAGNLEEVLRQADAAIVAFAGPSPEPSLFSRHSFPSRVADYAANGLPVFAICGHHTALADYMNESGAGEYDTAESVEQAATACAQFLTSIPLREKYSRQARKYAESNFDLEQQRSLFTSELAAVLPPGPHSQRQSSR